MTEMRYKVVTIAIKAGLLIEGTDRSPMSDVTVVIDKGRIIDIIHGNRDIPCSQTIDYSNKVVMPGLIDSHAHLQLPAGPDHASTIEIFLAEQQTGMTQMRSVQSAQRALLGGITTLQDCGSTIEIVKLRDAIAAGLPGPRLLVSGPPLTTTAGHGHFVSLRADSKAEIRKKTRWLIERGVDVIKIIASGGRATAGTNTLQPQYSQEEIAEAVNEAHRLGRRVVAHALNAETIRRCFAAGVDVIDHCMWHLPDGSMGFDPVVGEKMAHSDVTVGLTGSGYLRVLLDKTEDSLQELRSQLIGHRQMFDAGIRMTVHSDAGARFTYWEDFRESLQVMVDGLQLKPHDAIRAATQFAAESMGLGSDTGTVEVSKRADLLVLDKNPLEDIRNLRFIYHVIRDGRVLVDQGKLCPQWSLSSNPVHDRPLDQ